MNQYTITLARASVVVGNQAHRLALSKAARVHVRSTPFPPAIHVAPSWVEVVFDGRPEIAKPGLHREPPCTTLGPPWTQGGASWLAHSSRTTVD
jgi:hypothetical protein